MRIVACASLLAHHPADPASLTPRRPPLLRSLQRLREAVPRARAELVLFIRGVRTLVRAQEQVVRFCAQLLGAGDADGRIRPEKRPARPAPLGAPVDEYVHHLEHATAHVEHITDAFAALVEAKRGLLALRALLARGLAARMAAQEPGGHGSALASGRGDKKPAALAALNRHLPAARLRAGISPGERVSIAPAHWERAGGARRTGLAPTLGARGDERMEELNGPSARQPSRDPRAHDAGHAEGELTADRDEESVDADSSDDQSDAEDLSCSGSCTDSDPLLGDVDEPSDDGE